MSKQKFGFYFSANADASANDKTIYIQGDKQSTTLAIRYKNAEPNSIYEIELDSGDLESFAEMCLDLVSRMRMGETDG